MEDEPDGAILTTWDEFERNGVLIKTRIVSATGEINTIETRLWPDRRARRAAHSGGPVEFP
jgi:hypothetical protein